MIKVLFALLCGGIFYYIYHKVQKKREAQKHLQDMLNRITSEG